MGDFSAISNGLLRLRLAKSRVKVFGSEGHMFACNATLSESVVREFEAQYRIVLPVDYRSFLLEVGNGGAGPAYGLFPLGMEDGGTGDGPRPWYENDGFVGNLAAPFPHRRPWNDLAGKPEYKEELEDDSSWEDEYQRKKGLWEQVYWATANVNGAIPICHLGCAMRQWLVITGPEAGNVWDDNRADYGGLKPTQCGTRKRTTFLQWYKTWLEDALRQLE